MKTTGDIIEEIVMKWVRLQEIEDIEEERKIEIIIETQSKRITIPSKFGVTKEMLEEITERKISVRLKTQGDKIRIILDEPERQWTEACLS